MSTPEPIHIERIVIEADIPLTHALATSGLPTLVGLALGIGAAMLLEWLIDGRREKEEN